MMLAPDRRETKNHNKTGAVSPDRKAGILGICGRIGSSLILYPRYRLLWVSNLFFFTGVWTQTLVLGWLVFEITHSEFSVAVFTAARLAPMMLGPLSGVISDLFDRVKLLLIASAWAFGAMALIAALLSADMIPYWGLVVGGGASGWLNRRRSRRDLLLSPISSIGKV